MAKYERFEDLPVWQEAARLYGFALDFIEAAGSRISGAFRNQLERAALSVSNNIAEGFERISTNELSSFLGIARGSAGEVRSMLAVVARRPAIQPLGDVMARVHQSAESCSRQITGWIGSIESSRIHGKRHMTGEQKQRRRAAEIHDRFRLEFLRNMRPTHPLYHTTEARIARGEAPSAPA